MPISNKSNRQVTTALSFALLICGIHLLGLVGPRAVGQDQQTLSRAINITSDPPGATIWTKEGRNYVCSNQLTPGSTELKFHGQNDVKQVVLKKFGYSSRKLSVDAAHDQFAAKLTPWGAWFFAPPPGASPKVRSLDAKIKKEFEATLIAGNDPFPCAPYEFRSIAVVNSDTRNQLELGVFVDLHPSAIAKNLNVASKRHGASDEERRSGMGRMVLDGGMAEIVARVGNAAARFPDIKGLFIACSYSTSEAYIDVVETPYFNTYMQPSSDPRYLTEQVWVWGTTRQTAVKDQAAVRTLTIAVPLSALPGGKDTKAFTEAVLSHSIITLLGSEQ